ncbi:PPC domain-containing protein [Calycomorphotria hydatis]|uniref:Peptidase C-terminal archaeal/bacterial domain-containing protein n=1 Tax=Calycomorphotria hydatis TaxID=2528027 RepID=A0A517T9A3_9PLAN|nr:PPC domain-containing protein [Calycomorphotria hydatis]QDT64929.1 hypothetical protein V22_21740 [Calycomorphotria hydatis]
MRCSSLRDTLKHKFVVPEFAVRDIRGGMMLLRLQLAFVFALALVVSNKCLAGSPRLTTVTPRGVQRGAEHTLTFHGRYLHDPADVVFFDPEHFEVLSMEPGKNDRSFTAKILVKPECRLGEHRLFVRTSSGLSDFRALYVEELPGIDEKEPNSEFASAQEIASGHVVGGKIDNEDVDYFVVEAKKGERLTAEVVGIRLGDTFFDPYVAILDANRFELSAVDDSSLAAQDGAASIIVPEDGRYTIEVRDSAYRGNGSSYYRLNVGHFPRPHVVFPPGGKAGEEIEVRYIGDPKGEFTEKLTLPAEPIEGFGLYPADEGGRASTPNPFRVSAFGNVIEQEPNNSSKEGTPGEVPVAFNGVIEKDGDHDYFKFKAAKGQNLELNCFARRVGSGMDAVLHVFRADGKYMKVSDDDRYRPDSMVRFKVPEDGEYAVRVMDHLGKGSPDYVYRLEVTPVAPSLHLSIPTQERYGQYRQQIYVPRGNRIGSVFNVKRNDFGGDLKLSHDSMLPGITIEAENMPGFTTSMPVVFEATPEAEFSAKAIDFTASHTEKPEINGGFENTVLFVRYNANGKLHEKTVNKLSIGVVEEVPFKLEIVEPKVPIAQEGKLNLKVIAHRDEGFTKPITVEFPYRPPGVSCKSKITIPEGKNEIDYMLNANSKARVGDYKVFVNGSTNLGKGLVWAGSKLCPLKIAERYSTFELARAACEQGQETQIVCKITHQTPFEGTATATLAGFPPKSSAEPVTFTKDSEEVVFQVKTDAATPPGKRTLYCEIKIPQNSEEIVYRGGATQLQVDKPLPAPKSKPKSQPKPQVASAKKSPPKEKPLTRLEKLRLAAEARREELANNGGAP